MKRTPFTILAIGLFVSVIVNSCFAEEALLKEASIDSYIETAIEKRYFPGAQLVVGRRDSIIYSRCYGYHDYNKRVPVQEDDIYDIASCTKIMSTTLSIMRLVSEEKLELSAKLGDIVPEYKDMSVGGIAISDLLKHTSGMSAGVSVVKELVEPANDKPLYSVSQNATHNIRIANRLYMNKDIKYKDSFVSDGLNEDSYEIGKGLFLTKEFKEHIDSVVNKAYTPSRRGRYKYSDLNFYYLSKVVETLSGMTLDKYVEEIYLDLGVEDIGYLPLEWKSEDKIMPTEYDKQIRRDTLCGYVHDEFAACLGGVSGNAGLFANALSMAEVCRLFLGKGTIDDKNIIPSEVVDKFTSDQIPGTIWRGYGFDKQNPANGVYSAASYGHTGYTGTYFWVDPSKDIFVVFLTNRVYPTRDNHKLNSEYRSELWTMITK